MERIHLATALVRRAEKILLVASRYPNHEKPLWNMPGGRQHSGELLLDTVIRELREETGLNGSVERLAYISESYDGDTQFTNFTFEVSVLASASRSPFDCAQGPSIPQDDNKDHIVAAEWVPSAELESRLEVRVVREPLLAYLRGDRSGYAGYAEAGITVVFPD